jgi:hypothetical protein
MRDPLNERGEICYLTDSEGTRFRVYDVLYGKPTPGKKRVVPLENYIANHRYFVSESGLTRAYRFTKADQRALDPERLQQQFNGAGFVAVTPREIGARKPT